MRKKFDPIILHPLTISWTAWLKHARQLRNFPTKSEAQSIVRHVAAWQGVVDAWINSLSEQQKIDLMDLAHAEIDMLWSIFDTPRTSKFFEDERVDFRLRFYELQPLVATCLRLGVTNVERVDTALRNLEDYAMARMGWLP